MKLLACTSAIKDACDNVQLSEEQRQSLRHHLDSLDILHERLVGECERAGCRLPAPLRQQWQTNRPLIVAAMAVNTEHQQGECQCHLAGDIKSRFYM